MAQTASGVARMVTVVENSFMDIISLGAPELLTNSAAIIILNTMVNNQQQISTVFAALADPTRRQILAHLSRDGAGSVTALAKPFRISLPAISRHLRVLEKARLVKRERGPSRGVEEAGPMVRLFVGAGRKAGVRPGDLVGAITGEAGVTSQSVGAIEIADNFSLVEVPESLVDEIIAALRATMIRGKKVAVRRERAR